ncbi:hypothetical protein HY229_01830 [Candidatus Acetothermia bacterium]|nr:hypothetical protein [Candidatus Acetothermia bacterium]MBI3642828.1 hypothetical protein [Candidatus Acetothermia bacterium]
MRFLLAISYVLILCMLNFQGAVSQPTLSLTVNSGASVSASITRADVESGFVQILDQTQLHVSADVAWRVRASVALDSSPAGTGNPTPLSLEVGNNDNPGEFNPGSGIVQTGSAGTFDITVDFRLNLSTLGDAPAGSFNYTITYTLEPQ